MYLHQLLSNIMRRDFFQCSLYQTFRYHSILKTFSSQGQVYILHLTSVLQKLILIYHQVLFIFEDPCAFSPPIRMQFQLSLRKRLMTSSNLLSLFIFDCFSSHVRWIRSRRFSTDLMNIWDIWPLRGANYYRWVLCATMENKNTHPQTKMWLKS